MILLVEGEDDEHVVEHLCRSVGIGEWVCVEPEPPRFELPFTIINKRGYPKLLKGLPEDLKRSGLLALGVVADANGDLDANADLARRFANWLSDLFGE